MVREASAGINRDAGEEERWLRAARRTTVYGQLGPATAVHCARNAGACGARRAYVVEFPRSSVGAEATRWRPWRTDAVASELMGHRSVSLLHMDVVLNCTSYTHMYNTGLHPLLAVRCYVHS